MVVIEGRNPMHNPKRRIIGELPRTRRKVGCSYVYQYRLILDCGHVVLRNRQKWCDWACCEFCGVIGEWKTDKRPLWVRAKERRGLDCLQNR